MVKEVNFFFAFRPLTKTLTDCFFAEVGLKRKMKLFLGACLVFFLISSYFETGGRKLVSAAHMTGLL